NRAITLDGVMVTHADKVWWPDEGITKLDVAQFYARHARRLRPWVDDRPLTAERCPDGMRGTCFYQKNFTRGLPSEVPTTPIAAASTGKTLRYVAGGSTATLIVLVNLGCIAMHVMNCRKDSL